MIMIKIDDAEYYDSEKGQFFTVEGGVFRFKHTLWAVSLWEAEYKKPFLTSNLTEKELKAYYIYMCLDHGIRDSHITRDVYVKLTDYIGDPRTATVVHNTGEGSVSGSKTITSELIYSMMVAASVPFETENWNLNRLLKLLEVISLQNRPKEKMSKEDIYKQNRELNEKRKAQFNTKG